MNILVSLFAGLVFGVGLVLAGMTNPVKVLNFLDLFGAWDPSLAFVMGGAIAVAAPAFMLSGRLRKPVFAEQFSLPTRQDIDSQLLGGAALFGAGWGLVGLCPGPAITALSTGDSRIFLFFVFMIAGMTLVKAIRSNPGILSAT